MIIKALRNRMVMRNLGVYFVPVALFWLYDFLRFSLFSVFSLFHLFIINRIIWFFSLVLCFYLQLKGCVSQ